MNIKKLVAKALAFTFIINSLAFTRATTVKAADYWPSGVDVVAESAIVMEQEQVSLR